MESTSSSSPKRLPPDDLLDTPRRRASSSASSAAPPLSPENVEDVLKPPTSSSLTSLLVDFPSVTDKGLSEGTATALSPVSSTFFPTVAFFLFHGGSSASLALGFELVFFLLGTFFSRFQGGKDDAALSVPLAVSDSGCSSASASPSPAKRSLLLDLDETPRSRAKSSSSCAAPPRSPVKVEEVLNPPISSSDLADSLDSNDLLWSSEEEMGGPETTISTSELALASLFFVAAESDFLFHGGTSVDFVCLLPPPRFGGAFFPRFHGGRVVASLMGTASVLASAFVASALIGEESCSSPPANRSLLVDLDDTPRNKAKSSASSAAPPRSPVNVCVFLKPPSSWSLSVVAAVAVVVIGFGEDTDSEVDPGASSLPEIVASLAESELETVSAGRGGGEEPPAIDISTSNASPESLLVAAFVAPVAPALRFQGGSSPVLDRALLDDDAFFPRLHGGTDDSTFTFASAFSPLLPASASSSPPANRSLLVDLDDTPRNNASNSASSAAPPRSPAKVWVVRNPPSSSSFLSSLAGTDLGAATSSCSFLLTTVSSPLPLFDLFDTALSSASNSSSCASPLRISSFSFFLSSSTSLLPDAFAVSSPLPLDLLDTALSSASNSSSCASPLRISSFSFFLSSSTSLLPGAFAPPVSVLVSVPASAPGPAPVLALLVAALGRKASSSNASSSSSPRTSSSPPLLTLAATASSLSPSPPLPSSPPKRLCVLLDDTPRSKASNSSS